VSTSNAETSLTLPGVVYVVGSCYVKQAAYNPLLGLEGLLVVPTSKVGWEGAGGRAAAGCEGGWTNGW
jgi:HrpA-like RNA helicase